MGKYILSVVGIAFTVNLLINSQQAFATAPATPTEVPKTKGSPQWSEKMQSLYKSLGEVLADISSNERFNSPKNKTQIENHAKKLASLAHDLGRKDVTSPDNDPTIKILSGLFSDEAQHAYDELKRGNRTYARGLLRSISGYCVACHTRNQSGPEFSKLPMQLPASTVLPIEQGEFYAATRQYDLAQEIFKKIIDDTSISAARPFEWARAVNQSISIAVRVKKDPDQTLEIIERILSNKNAPYFLKQTANEWKKSTLEWKNEGARKAMTEEGLYVEAVRLTSQAHNLQKYPLDRSADILYLRSTSILHELLQTAPDGPHSDKAFFMAGLCYEVLRPLNLEELHEFYYEACIKKAPHTPTAELCYHHYQESIYAGYTGSTGTDLPNDVKEKLSGYATLALPTGAAPN